MSEIDKHDKKLGWFLCWAVVFADIGTSIYYVPGILYGQVNNLAGFFVLLTNIVFILLVIKYVEISAKFPEGGGVVAVASKAFNPWFGALGGMFITVDFFLTAAISSVSGFNYLDSVVDFGQYILLAAIIGLIFFGILNVIGIKESAGVTAVVAVSGFVINIILVGVVLSQIGTEGWKLIGESFKQVSTLSPWSIVTGSAGAFLAFSGLEAITQLSPAMQTPRMKVAGKAMLLVTITIFLTSPLLTLFTTNLLNAKVPGGEETVLESVSKVKEREELIKSTNNVDEKEKLQEEVKVGKEYSERFISELGAQYGGVLMKVSVIITASILLLFAANTAIIGAYHVFISLARKKFLPKKLLHFNKFDTPHWAVILAVLPPILIIIVTKGDLNLLGQLYAFGLLGDFMLSSLGLDVFRWKNEHKINVKFLVGILTTLIVFVAWAVNLYSKPLATIFGGSVTILGMITAFYVRKVLRKNEVDEPLEGSVEEEKQLPHDQVFLPVFDEFDPKLFEYAGKYAQENKKDIVLMYIREITDVLQTVYESIEYDQDAVHFMNKAKEILVKYNVKIHEIYECTHDTGELINESRDYLNPSITIMSPHKESIIMEFLKGDIMAKVNSYKKGKVIVYQGE